MGELLTDKFWETQLLGLWEPLRGWVRVLYLSPAPTSHLLRGSFRLSGALHRVVEKVPLSWGYLLPHTGTAIAVTLVSVPVSQR